MNIGQILFRAILVFIAVCYLLCLAGRVLEAC